jgi:AhpC/TSA family
MIRRLFVLFLLALTTLPALSQTRDSLPPYLKFPVIPQFKILKTDSLNWIQKQDLDSTRVTVFIVFHPDCEHCQTQVKEIVSNMDQFSAVQFVMTTYQPLAKLQGFIMQYGLDQYPNIFIGRDVGFFFGPFYNFKNTPFVAVYNKARQLSKVFDGGTKWRRLLDAVRE